jgi:chemotaxis protein MotB
MADQVQPIIVKKVKKGGHGSHGGAWKIAYADFVTAMMAFFLLLWLLNSVTQEQLEGISNYFAPASIARTTSGAGGMFGGTALSAEGTMQNLSSSPSVTVDLPPPKAGTGSQDAVERELSAEEAAAQLMEADAEAAAEAAAELVQQQEQEQFEQAANELREQIESLPQGQELLNSLVIENTPEGMRIQIVDQKGLAMFPSGSSDMFDHTRNVLRLVSEVIEKLPQDISITGHTDSTRFAGGDLGYTNWELSADRANATRRALIELGVPPNRLARVVGSADQDPLDASDPASSKNRRIAIVLLRGTGEDQVINVP